MSGHLITAVVVHWNTPELLDACLDSIREEYTSDRRLERVVVIDCASPGKQTSEVARKHPWANLIALPSNDGYAAGCNAGYTQESSEFVLFLNADVEVCPGAVEHLLRCINLNPTIGLVAPLLVNADGSLQSAGYRFPGIANVLFDLLPLPDRLRGSAINGIVDPGNRYHPYAVDYALGAALLVRRAALDQIGGWSEEYQMYSEEIDLARRLAAAGWSRLIEPRATVVHHGGASTTQQPAAMQMALWRSRGLYHRRWTSTTGRLALRLAVEGAARLGQGRDRGPAIRRAFANGLDGR